MVTKPKIQAELQNSNEYMLSYRYKQITSFEVDKK